MYCIHCGKEIDDDSVFCVYCGEKVILSTAASSKQKDGAVVLPPPKADDSEQESSANEPSDTQSTQQAGENSDNVTVKDVMDSFREVSHILLETPAESRNDTICPYCNSPGCQPMQKSTTEVKNKNYSWGNGCCGMIFLGPFGLLCGLYGTGSNVKMTSELWWTCLKCGKQHIAVKDTLKKWNNFMSSLAISGIMMGIFFLIVGWLELGLFSILLQLFCVIVPAGGAVSIHQEISEESGVPLIDYMPPELKKKSLGMICLATALILIIGLFGVPILAYVVGE